MKVTLENHLTENSMTERSRIDAVLNYKPYDRMPLVHFGFWRETLDKWVAEGHLSPTETPPGEWKDGNTIDGTIGEMLGFDLNWNTMVYLATFLFPPFEKRVLHEFADGARHVLTIDGAVRLEKPGVTSIPAEVDRLFKGRKEWEELFLPRLQFVEERVTQAYVPVSGCMTKWAEGGLEFLRSGKRDIHLGISCGSLIGKIRNMLGVEGCTYLYAEDPALFEEIVDTVGELSYRCVRFALESGAQFDFGHFWEDICCTSGPLVSPTLYSALVGPHYRRVAKLLRKHGITIVSLDCDGVIDVMIPIWLSNGINTMFPIEVGTWKANIGAWRQIHGEALRGVGGVNKNVFSLDREAVDKEIERLRPLVELGGYIPCPDHRIGPESKWDNVRYYCDQMRYFFG